MEREVVWKQKEEREEEIRYRFRSQETNWYYVYAIFALTLNSNRHCQESFSWFSRSNGHLFGRERQRQRHKGTERDRYKQRERQREGGRDNERRERGENIHILGKSFTKYFDTTRVNMCVPNARASRHVYIYTCTQLWGNLHLSVYTMS